MEKNTQALEEQRMRNGICRYLHIAGPVSGSSGARRRSSPVVSDSALPGHVSVTRRGSEPSLFPALNSYSWRRGSEPLVPSLNQQTLQCLTADITEEEEEHAVVEAGSKLQQQESDLQLQESDALVSHDLPCNVGDKSAANATFDQEKADSKTDQLETGATASFGQNQSEAYIQSKDVVCGICMDKVYEKSAARERRFGILPNCSHAFCLGCIMTWRKTKDFQEEVIKACPQCRVKSPFYIPSKYWVSDDEPKKALIASFKEKSSKMKCNFYMCHGCCPFASECIFSHELPPGHRPHRRCFRPKRFGGRSRLLVHALLTGGVTSAQKVFLKQRGVDGYCPLSALLKTLCQDEASLDEQTHSLTTQPLVTLFPDVFKRDLLSFLHLLHPGLPRQRVLALLRCLSKDAEKNPWVCALITQLYKDLGVEEFRNDKLLTPECVLKLKDLCDRFKDSQEKRGWDFCLNEKSTDELSADCQTDLCLKKRKSGMTDQVDSGLDEPEIKRRRTDLAAHGSGEDGAVVVSLEESDVKAMHLNKELEGDSSVTAPEPEEDCGGSLPDYIKAAVPLLKESLDSGTEWDESCVLTLKVLNECDANQLEMFCTVLCLSEAPEQSLPHFCSSVLALSPDLSYSTASVIIKNLLLGKVCSLTESPSRCLVTAVTSLCSRYPRPTCQALIEPLIKERHTESAQAELLCRLVKDCLEPHHRLIVFQMTLVSSWNEGVLSVIHDLLDSKLELNEEIFSQFTNQLSSQSPHFTKSMRFAKVMLTVLTKFQPHVTAECQHTLSCCISFNETFLKKSLQAALKRIDFLFRAPSGRERRAKMSKVSRDTLYEAVREVQAGSISKRRKFLETVELQISLKNYDPQKDKRFSGTVRLKTTPRPKFSVCVLGDQQHCDEAKAAEIPHMDIEALKKLNKNKKLVKKLAKKYDAFLASESLIKQIPRILGPGLNKAGKFPSLLTHNENMSTKVDEVKSTIKFQMKKVLCLAVAVGHVRMTEDELVYNIHLAVNFLVSLLKKNWQNVRALYIKSTMGKPQRLY
ncbi:60S ribosomal protein L10a [Bagarius yarrelli]|uniref:Large ribosomal subunit protein uL1 n=1 Tax=Bagarius yarrelli TaxID=175774 RepID=A0A556V6F1_BAGYA|nr:60S ribosomal protein L10a [Bagarius yarrelli]